MVDIFNSIKKPYVLRLFYFWGNPIGQQTLEVSSARVFEMQPITLRVNGRCSRRRSLAAFSRRRASMSSCTRSTGFCDTRSTRVTVISTSTTASRITAVPSNWGLGGTPSSTSTLGPGPWWTSSSIPGCRRATAACRRWNRLVDLKRGGKLNLLSPKSFFFRKSEWNERTKKKKVVLFQKMFQTERY